MSSIERPDDFEQRREHLERLSDEELHAYFWQLVDQIVAPLIEEARTNTSPSIERSVLLRMGFSSVEAIANYLVQHSSAGDHILIMSNGGFGGLHKKLAEALAQNPA